MKNEEQLSLAFPASWERLGRIKFHLNAVRTANDPLFAFGSEHLAIVPDMIMRPGAYWRRVIVVRNGKERVCHEATGALKNIHLWLLGELKRISGYWKLVLVIGKRRRFLRDACYQPSEATAFYPGCSIVRNATQHRKSRSSYSVDLVNAYGQIRAKHIRRFLLRAGLSRSASWLVSKLVTFHGSLPQGAIVSPFLFNRMMERFDRELSAMLFSLPRALPDQRFAEAREHYVDGTPFSREDQAKIEEYRHRFIYTRYCDDLCFSARSEEFPEDAKRAILDFIAAQGFAVNEKKTREGRNGVLELPGVVCVRGRLQPNRKYIMKLRRFKEMAPVVQQGHLSYIRQFSRSARRRIRRELRLAGSKV